FIFELVIDSLQQGVPVRIFETDWKQVNGRIVPVKDGKWLPFVPGKTWINIVPDLDAASISKGEGV
ncbi:hypothetical protein MOC06_00845, partial [Bacillus inaquosorum]|nr:hypothetical protein [Bacillus inaquosorum]